MSIVDATSFSNRDNTSRRVIHTLVYSAAFQREIGLYRRYHLDECAKILIYRDFVGNLYQLESVPNKQVQNDHNCFFHACT